MKSVKCMITTCTVTLLLIFVISIDIDIAMSATKSIIRSEIKAKLRALSNEYLRTQSNLINDRLLDLSEFQCSRGVSVFLSMPSSEVYTDSIICSIFECGKSTFIPKGTFSFSFSYLMYCNVAIM